MSRRNPFEPRQVTSRRGGRTKPPLSQEAIVTAALDLLAREGAEGTSLRKVAAALDTGPATLYAYVDDLQELQALMLDRALGEVQTGGNRRGDCRRRLMALLESYFDVLTARPGLAKLAQGAIAAGPNALRLLEALLGLLDEAGVEPATAAWAVDLVLLYATAIAAEHGQRSADRNPLAPVALALASVTAASHPRVHALRDQLVSGDGRARFAWAVEVLLEGLLATPRAAAGRPSRKITPGR